MDTDSIPGFVSTKMAHSTEDIATEARNYVWMCALAESRVLSGTTCRRNRGVLKPALRPGLRRPQDCRGQHPGEDLTCVPNLRTFVPE